MTEQGSQNSILSIADGEDMNDFLPEKRPGEPQQVALIDFEYLRITKEKNIPRPAPLITIGGGAVASAGNITGISAAAKAGKTALVGVLLAGAISKDDDIDGFPELKVIPNPESKAVIHFDTEQSDADQQYFINTILKRAKYDSTPDNFLSYNIRQLTLNNYRDVTDKICELANEKYGGIHLIIIDGGADFIASVNDEIGANNIVQYFIHTSIKYYCPVIVIVHLNPGSDKERGHFGSEVQRKCYGLITIKKDGDVSTAEPKIMRKAGIGQIPLIHYSYDIDRGYHVAINAPDRETMKNEKNMLKTKEIAKAVFPPLASYTFTESISRIMKETKQGESSAKTKLRNMTGWGFVVKGVDDRYRINLDSE